MQDETKCRKENMKTPNAVADISQNNDNKSGGRHLMSKTRFQFKQHPENRENIEPESTSHK